MKTEKDTSKESLPTDKVEETIPVEQPEVKPTDKVVTVTEEPKTELVTTEENAIEEQEKSEQRKEDIKRLAETLKAYLKKHYPIQEIFAREGDVQDMRFNKFKLSRRKQILLQLLQLSPWICAIGFALSFFLDFGATHFLTIAGYSLPLQGLMKTVGVAGLIGYGTNYIAIKMLFRPIEKRPIWGQGLIPGQRDRIIHSLARGIHKHILSEDLIRKRIEESQLITKINRLMVDGTVGLLEDKNLRREIKEMLQARLQSYFLKESVRAELRTLIDTRLESQVNTGLKGVLLRTYKRYNRDDYEGVIDRLVIGLPETILEVIGKLEQDIEKASGFIMEHDNVTEELMMKVFMDLLQRIDTPHLLRKQMEHFDEAKLEKMIWEATNEQLLYIQYLGTVLGILGGLLIWQPIFMAGFYLILFLSLYGLDNLLFKQRQNQVAKEGEATHS